MNTHKVFRGALHLTGAVLATTGVAAISCLCLRGAIAPLREANLREQIHRAKAHGRRDGNRKGYQDGYQVGLRAGRAIGRDEGHKEGYDSGYLDAYDGEYEGENPEILARLGITPEQQAKKLAEKETARIQQEQAEGWENMERVLDEIFRPAPEEVTPSPVDDSAALWARTKQVLGDIQSDCQIVTQQYGQSHCSTLLEDAMACTLDKIADLQAAMDLAAGASDEEPTGGWIQS